MGWSIPLFGCLSRTWRCSLFLPSSNECKSLFNTRTFYCSERIFIFVAYLILYWTKVHFFRLDRLQTDITRLTTCTKKVLGGLLQHATLISDDIKCRLHTPEYFDMGSFYSNRPEVWIECGSFPSIIWHSIRLVTVRFRTFRRIDSVQVFTFISQKDDSEKTVRFRLRLTHVCFCFYSFVTTQIINCGAQVEKPKLKGK